MIRYLREYGSTVLIVAVGAFLLYKLAVGGPHPLEGKPAPDFSLHDTQGNMVTLASYKGKDVVVLDFWATWCPACRKGLPVVNAVAKHFAGKPVAVYGVNIREGADLVKAFAKQQGLSLPLLLDDKGLVADDYAVSGIPQTVVIGKDGIIHAVDVGVPLWGFEGALTREVNRALAAP